MKPLVFRASVVALFACVCFGAFVRAQDDAPKTEIIQATDTAALKAASGQTVQVEGVIKSAKWSGSGKVMNIEFEGPDGEQLLAAIFEKTKTKFDEAFNGDAAASFTGAKVRVKGKIEEYGGKVEKLQGRLQILLKNTSQITLLEASSTTAPTSAPTTAPAGM